MHQLPAVCQLDMFWPQQPVHCRAQHFAAGSLQSCATTDPPVCRPDSWRQREALQQPQYPDAAAVDEAIAEINRMPPLVFAGECRTLQQRLAACAAGDAFWLQGGDCAGGQGCSWKGKTPSRPLVLARHRGQAGRAGTWQLLESCSYCVAPSCCPTHADMDSRSYRLAVSCLDAAHVAWHQSAAPHTRQLTASLWVLLTMSAGHEVSCGASAGASPG